MKILLVYAHPEPTSFNAALRDKAISVIKQHHHQLQVSDLYQMHFKAQVDWQDFIVSPDAMPHQYGVAQKQAYLNHQFSIDIQHEQQKLAWANLVIFQFPLWWFSMPAIMKGWLDRVLACGFAYDKGQWFDNGLLRPRQATLTLTTQSPQTAYSSIGVHGDIEQYLLPIHHTLRFVGLTPRKPFVAYEVMNDDVKYHQDYLLAYEQHLLNLLS